MRQSYLRALDTQFDLSEVAVAGRPTVAPGRFASGKKARFLPAELERAVEPGPAAPAPQPPPPPMYTQAELDAAVAEARDQAAAEAAAAGREEARNEVLTGLAAAQSDAVRAAAGQLAGLQGAFDAAITELRAQARTLILEVVRAVIPRALERAPLADIEDLLQDLVPRLEAEPELHLEVAPELVEPGRSAVAELAAKSRYRGEFTVAADPALGPGDARLSWRKGEAERRLAEVSAAAIEIAEGWLNACANDRPDDASPSEPPDPKELP